MITTSRLRLIPATDVHLRASLQGPDAFAACVACSVPSSWPPEHFDPEAVKFALEWLRKRPADTAWWFYWIELPNADGTPGTLVGAGGFKGAPDADGIVELGYSVLPDFRGRAYGLEAVQGWVDFAFGQPKVQMICAHTLAAARPAIHVLKKAGFRVIGRGHDPGAPPDQEVVRLELLRRT